MAASITALTDALQKTDGGEKQTDSRAHIIDVSAGGVECDKGQDQIAHAAVADKGDELIEVFKIGSGTADEPLIVHREKLAEA